MSRLKIERAMVEGVKADFVKGEVKVTLRMPLETGLEVRSELVGYAEGEELISVEIRPWQKRLPLMDGMTVSVGYNAGGGKEESNGDAPAD